MNPLTLSEAVVLAESYKTAAAKLSKTEVVICPPYIFLEPCAKILKSSDLNLGCQDLSTEPAGSQTGEVSATMLKGLGVEYAILGHSERRGKGETSEMVRQKVAQALEAGISPIVCVGELARDDENGSHFELIRNQLRDSLGQIAKKSLSSLVIAYEPVWAIGALQAMDPGQICETALFVRKTLADLFGQDYGKKVRVVYGGSVNSTNAAEIVSAGQVDGLLVGRESLSKSGFGELMRCVDEIGAKS